MKKRVKGTAEGCMYVRRGREHRGHRKETKKKLYGKRELRGGRGICMCQTREHRGQTRGERREKEWMEGESESRV